MGNTWFHSNMKQDLRGQCTVVCRVAGNKVLWMILFGTLQKDITCVFHNHQGWLLWMGEMSETGSCSFRAATGDLISLLTSAKRLQFAKLWNYRCFEPVKYCTLCSSYYQSSCSSLLFFLQEKEHWVSSGNHQIIYCPSFPSQLNKVCWRIFAVSLPIPYSV